MHHFCHLTCRVGSILTRSCSVPSDKSSQIPVWPLSWANDTIKDMFNPQKISSMFLHFWLSALALLPLTTTCDGTIMSVLQIRKLRFKQVKQLVPSHTALQVELGFRTECSNSYLPSLTPRPLHATAQLHPVPIVLKGTQAWQLRWRKTHWIFPPQLS